MFATTTIRPGLLVSLKTEISGNVRYYKQTIEAPHLTEEGTEEARWETLRAIIDPTEWERAKTTRNKARSMIAGVCISASNFGLLCPKEKADELKAVTAEARRMAEEFNRSAKVSRISIYVLTGEIAQNDVEAVSAINSDIRKLLDEMTVGLANLDVKAVREAANKARAMGAMLSQDAQGKVSEAVEFARSAARKIVRTMKDSGEQAAVEIDRVAIRMITEARTAFLDLDVESGEIAAPEAETRDLDLGSDEPEAVEIAAPKAVAFEL